MKKLLAEFKTFAIKGNMIDMAIGVIVGGAFSAIVNSIVTNIATPLIGILIGVDFRDWTIELPRIYGNAPPSVLGIGIFLNSIINFFVVGITLFAFLKAVNKFRKKQDETPPPAPPKPTAQEVLLTEIRDLLRESINIENISVSDNTSEINE